MRPAGRKVSEARRIAIIILVIQIFGAWGMGPVGLATAGPGLHATPTGQNDRCPAPDRIQPTILTVAIDACLRAPGPIEVPSADPRSAPFPIARWLLRARPA